jgi:SSS family solute:Na+ symporter
MGHLESLDLVVITAYAVGVIFIGVWSSRKQNSTEEYFVGSRGMNPLIAGISISATLLSTISYLAYPGEMIKNGPGWMWQMLHAPITFAVVGFFIIPKLMAQPITSAYQLLEERFGMGVRRAAACMFILARIFWMGLVIYTCSFAVAQLSGLPIQGVLIAVGILGTAYTVVGGIRAVMITDAIQFVVLLGGALLTIGFISYKCGGLTAWWPDWDSAALQSLQWKDVKFFSTDVQERVSIVTVVLHGATFWILTATGDQVLIQRFLTTRDTGAARRSFAFSLICDMFIGLSLSLTGIALCGFYLQFPETMPTAGADLTAQADKMFPHFIGAVLPAGLSGLVVAALFAAAMSSLDSGISSISTVLMTDFASFFAQGTADDTDRLRRARFWGIIIGTIAITMSFLITVVPGKNILDMTVRVSGLLAAPMFVTFVLAFFVKNSTPAGAWAAIVVGAVMANFLAFSETITGLLFGSSLEISIALIMPVSAVSAIVTGVVVSQFTQPRAAGEG